MKSYEVLREAADRIGVKALAARLNLSTALVYKWCQESQQQDPTSSGARNPLDRLKGIYEATNDPRVVNWICHECDGFFVRNPEVNPDGMQEQLLNTTQRVVQDFGQMLGAVSRSIEDDGFISEDEAIDIRQSWEALKAQAEQFVVACERGMYGSTRSTP